MKQTSHVSRPRQTPPTSRVGVSSLLFFHRDCTEKGWGTHPPHSPAYPFTTQRRRTGSPRAHFRPLGHLTNDNICPAATRTTWPRACRWPKTRREGPQIRASARDSPTSAAQRTLALSAGDTQAMSHLGCSGDTQALSNLGEQWEPCSTGGGHPNLAPSWRRTGVTPRHLGTQRAPCPSAADTPASSHQGTPRTLSLRKTHQPQSIKALNRHLSLCWGHPGLRPSWHSTDTCRSLETHQPQAFLACGSAWNSECWGLSHPRPMTAVTFCICPFWRHSFRTP